MREIELGMIVIITQSDKRSVNLVSKLSSSVIVFIIGNNAIMNALNNGK